MDEPNGLDYLKTGPANFHPHSTSPLEVRSSEAGWIEATDAARRRWNNDHQPHPESW
jgi:hypothetical protein